MKPKAKIEDMTEKAWRCVNPLLDWKDYKWLKAIFVEWFPPVLI